MERKMIQEGLALLKKEKYYDQSTVVKKLRSLGFIISESTFSNILNGKVVKAETLIGASQGIRSILQLELGVIWKTPGYAKTEEEGWEPTVVRELTPKEPSLVIKPGFAFHEEGRLPIHQKVAFFSTAQKEIIEFGVTLNTFTSYFSQRSDSEFKSHVEVLLEKGVHFKCFLLDPDCNEARLYFDDRKRSKEEPRGIETIRESIRKLAKIQKEFQGAGYAGNFKIYTYKHVPYNYFMTVDSDTVNGKMMISHYIYGVSRANCPVIEFSKSENKSLYKKYWTSLQLIVKDAKEVIASI